MGDAVSTGEDVALCINSGSSSLKFTLFVVGEAGETFRPVAVGAVERIGIADGRAWLRVDDERRELQGEHGDHASALDTAFTLLEEAHSPVATMVGHRVVHGGALHVEPARIDDALVESLRALVPLAPLHLPAAIEGITAVAARYPDLPQVACFDTAFHASMPEIARRLPLPDRFDQEGIRRYGFHGLSYEYVMSTLAPSAPPRIVIAHLGNGSSLVAVKDGRAIDTTMGFTPVGGILMGTRTGDIDPGALLYLLREKGLSTAALEKLVEHESGLTAIGGTSDMKSLLASALDEPRSNLAVSMFGYAVKKAIGGFIAALGGLDLLVFTGGIGEHAPRVRADACDGLEALGIHLETSKNERNADVISSPSSPCVVRVVETNEDLVIARHAYATVRGQTT